ncbi:MAG: SIMPL domain-containing protein [Candidatus Ornithospirochaeta sp.]
MKKTIVVALSVALVLLLAGCSSLGGRDSVVPTVSVSASATLELVPDSASFSITAENTKATTEEARNASAAMVEKAVEILADEFGIGDDSLTTDYMVVSPYYEWLDGGRTLIGQKATQKLTIVLSGDNLEKVGKVYDRLSVLDGISISTISYSRLDTTEEVDRVRRMATKEALGKATAYAEGLGLKVGKVITVSDGASVSYSQNVYSTSMKLAVAEAAPADYSSTPYYQGSITVSDSVTVVFTLE